VIGAAENRKSYMPSFTAELLIITARESGNMDRINGSDDAGLWTGFEPSSSPAPQPLALGLLSYTALHSPLKWPNYFFV